MMEESYVGTFPNEGGSCLKKEEKGVGRPRGRGVRHLLRNPNCRGRANEKAARGKKGGCRLQQGGRKEVRPFSCTEGQEAAWHRRALKSKQGRTFFFGRKGDVTPLRGVLMKCRKRLSPQKGEEKNVIHGRRDRLGVTQKERGKERRRFCRERRNLDISISSRYFARELTLPGITRGEGRRQPHIAHGKKRARSGVSARKGGGGGDFPPKKGRQEHSRKGRMHPSERGG